MNAPHSNFLLRERKFWESTDLSQLMFRRFFPVLAATFGSIYILSSAAILFFIGPIVPWLPALVVWWLKPLWERIIMAPVGVLFFNPEASPRMLFASLKRIFSPDVLRGITFFRPNFFDSFLIPVSMFEHPDRSKQSERRRWLCNGIAGQLFGLAAVFFLVDIVIFCSFYYGLMFIVSISMLGVGGDTDLITGYVALNICWFVAMLITEPLYQLSAFALYVNRRTMHEGWDIRLALQKLASVAREKSGRITAIAIVILASCFVGFKADALETADTPETSYETRLEKIINDRDFGGVEKTNVLRFKNEPESEEPAAQTGDVPDFLAFLSANILQVIAILGGSTVIIVLFVFIVRRLQGSQLKKPKYSNRADIAAVSPGMQSPEPELASSLAAWERSDQRLALALLYRVCISIAKKRFGVKITESATEGNCLLLLGRSNTDVGFSELFTLITKAWMQVSWSDRPVTHELYHELYKGLQTQVETG